MLELLKWLADILLHLDQHLGEILRSHGRVTYLILFVIIFSETGLIVTAFLPGDSLLFAAGALAALSDTPLNIGFLFALLTLAAILGNFVNYSIGKRIGAKSKKKGNSYGNGKHLERTKRYFDKYGGKAIIITRFIPIVRAFAPFIAGSVEMEYQRFTIFNVIGGVSWVATCVFAGYFFGNIPVIKNNLSILVLSVVFISLSLSLIEFLRHRRRESAQRQAKK